MQQFKLETEEQYQAALLKASELMQLNTRPQSDKVSQDSLNILIDMIEAYEEIHYPMELE